MPMSTPAPGRQLWFVQLPLTHFCSPAWCVGFPHVAWGSWGSCIMHPSVQPRLLHRSNDGAFLVTGGDDTLLKIWSLGTSKALHSYDSVSWCVVGDASTTSCKALWRRSHIAVYPCPPTTPPEGQGAGLLCKSSAARAVHAVQTFNAATAPGCQ